MSRDNPMKNDKRKAKLDQMNKNTKDKQYRKDADKNESSGRNAGRKTGGKNDAAWYAANPQLLADSANVAYSWPLGSKLDFNTDKPIVNYSGNYNNKEISSVPGVLAVGINCCPGYSSDNSSPINIAARNIYSYVRHANSGHSNYDSPDLMMYLLAMDSIFTLYSHLVRVYGIARTYSQVNRYYPDAIISSMGIDPSTVYDNLANLRARINQLGVKIGAMAVPTSMSYMVRHWWLFSSVYTDAASSKSQIYLFHPTCVYDYRETQYTTGGCLRPIYLIEPTDNGEREPVAQSRDIFDLLEILDRMISSVMESEDCNIMSGDIIKAFGAENLYRLPQVPEDYTIIPEVNAEVLVQINNLVAIGFPYQEEVTYPENKDDTFATDDIYQRPDGAIIYAPRFGTYTPGFTDKWILNMPIECPTPADTMVATRLSNVATDAEATQVDGIQYFLHKFEYLGSDYATHFTITTFEKDTDGAWKPMFAGFNKINDVIGFKMLTYMVYGDNAYAGLVDMLSELSKFNFHPSLIPVIRQDNGYYKRGKINSNLQTVALITADDLAKMHTTALLSEFNVPTMGAWSRK